MAFDSQDMMGVDGDIRTEPRAMPVVRRRLGTMSIARLRKLAIVRFFVGTALALVLTELVVRQVYMFPMRSDADFGWVPQSGSIRWCLEGCATSRWGAHGLRVSAPPDPSVPSILAVGDSFTEAVQVDDREVYTQRLERRLEANRLSIPVVNGGHAGFSAADHVALAPRYRALLRPRWTIVQLSEDDLTADPWQKDRAGFSYFTDGSDGIQVVAGRIDQPGALWYALQPLRRHLGLYTYGMARVREFTAAAAAQPPLFFAGSTPRARHSDRSDEPQPYRVGEVLDLLRRAYDGRVTFLYLPTFDPQSPATSASRVESEVDRLCATRGWSCVNIRSTYADFARRHRSPFGFANSGYNVGHLNAEGHDAVANALSAEIQRLVANGIF